MICDNHGDFKQSPNSHLKGSGCPKCSTNISKPATKWLDSLNIATREYKITLKNGSIIPVDGYDPSTCTVYQFHGDYWHGNPEKYHPQEINQRNKQKFGDLFLKTWEQDEIIKQTIAPNGDYYRLISIWESDAKFLNVI